MISRRDIADAHRRIEPYIRQTPLLDLGADEFLPVAMPICAPLAET